MSILLATKLHRPSVPPNRVKRPHLIELLNEGLEFGRKVTLVSAPAGFGKTLCVSEWVNDLDMPVSWLSLDNNDNDPGRFFTYLVAALQNIDENIAADIEGVLLAGQLPPAEIISATLINDILDQEERFVLVLDDLQVIHDSLILDILNDLIENPSTPMHLVLLTREDPSLPLARLRGNNQMTEIRAGDLRFSPPDSEIFLNQVMGLGLQAADISSLEDKTEGWIVGLQLAGLSIKGRESPADFIADLSGSHRFILSYLTEEVINRQPIEIQHFLLQTSILDSFCGDLCNAVSGRDDSHTLLEQLFKANLFLIPLDGEGRWYRYHQLFVDLLLDQLEVRLGEDTNHLHLRASRWYIDAGMVSEAIEHALAGGDYDTAVKLIDSHAMDMIMQWHLKTVEGWRRAIPDEWSTRSPRANLAFAWMHLIRGENELMAPYLGRLGEMFSDPKNMSESGEYDPSLEARWLALQSMMLNAQGMPKQSLQICNRALEIASEGDTQVLNMIHLGQASAYDLMEDYENAVASFQAIIQSGQEAGNSVTELLGISGLALMLLQHGEYHIAYDIVTRGMMRIERSGALPGISTAVYGELGVIHYQWFQLEKAHEQFKRAIQVSTLSGFSDAEVYYGVILSRLHLIRGDREAADREIQKVFELANELRPAAVQEEVIAQKVRIDIIMGRFEAAEASLKEFGFSFREGFAYPDPSQAGYSLRQIGVLHLAALRYLLRRAQARPDTSSFETGIELAGNLIGRTLLHGYIPFAIETLLLRAQMYTIMGEHLASQDDYVKALELAEPERLITIFVEEGQSVAEAISNLQKSGRTGNVQPGYVQGILDAFSLSGLPAGDREDISLGDGLFEPLTERELEVLRLVSEGMTYNEIAGRLHISLNTVRSHVKAIYRKLGVNNRTKAIELARTQGIL